MSRYIIVGDRVKGGHEVVDTIEEVEALINDTPFCREVEVYRCGPKVILTQTEEQVTHYETRWRVVRNAN